MSTHITNQDDEFAQPMQTTETAQQSQYEAYLLRLWRSDGKTWHASLQSVRTGERHMFADRESLLTFLSRQLGAAQEEENSDATVIQGA